MMEQSRIIVHIDMDAFFVAVERRGNPHLLNKPVIVGADPKEGHGRGVVSTCSYEARAYGIHSAMPISTAYKLCPGGIFLRGNMPEYKKVSRQIFDILYDFTPDVEPVSIDEAFMDITQTAHLLQTPRATCLAIKQRIKNDLQLTSSIGIAPNKSVAKIASDYCKPDGLLEILSKDMMRFLWALPIEKMWGVGVKTKRTLNAMNIETVRDLARTPVELLCRHLGKQGAHLFALANGQDAREVKINDEIKSVSHEHTFEIDTSDMEKIYRRIALLSEKVSRRLRKYGLKGKTVTLKLRSSLFKTCVRAYTFSSGTNFFDVINKKGRDLFDEAYVAGTKIRLIGIRVSGFKNQYVQESLFENEVVERIENVHKAVDLIKDKFGENAIRRAGAIRSRK